MSNTEKGNDSATKTTAMMMPIESDVPGVGWSNYAPHPTPIDDGQRIALAPYVREGRMELFSRHRRWIGVERSSWTRIGDGNANDARHSKSSSSSSKNNNNIPGEVDEVDLAKEAYSVRCLIAQLCEVCFYKEICLSPPHKETPDLTIVPPVSCLGLLVTTENNPSFSSLLGHVVIKYKKKRHSTRWVGRRARAAESAYAWEDHRNDVRIVCSWHPAGFRRRT